MHGWGIERSRSLRIRTILCERVCVDKKPANDAINYAAAKTFRARKFCKEFMLLRQRGTRQGFLLSCVHSLGLFGTRDPTFAFGYNSILDCKQHERKE
jgi:hypothetical protein